ncbi:sigma-54 dependent transcriptional regulator [Marinomonas sp. MED121]|uniref:sigma-54 interaction domain-containing protein n=1 Tax=Marinomonas sp. MED121 TaxID=314277 RepID=UPI000068FE85|nr:sigma 54-interacting transcriptional regulator [Marinomonas sp. MED121]EAQ66624.1 sigma-54 dependent transcriptional regulator [Marinomonas sp. MED121]
MNLWLRKAVEQGELRDETALINQYTSTLKEQMGLSLACVIMPSHDGSRLEVIDHPQSINWEVNDFNNPFSHVLQATTPMVMSLKKLLYWRSDAGFSALVGMPKNDEMVVIHPLPPGNDKVKAMVLMVGPADQVMNLSDLSEWQQYSAIFMNQLGLIKDIGKQAIQKVDLVGSLTRLKKEGEQRESSISLATRLVGSSEKMQKLRHQIITAAQSTLTVLVQGETGTGKELVARAVHDYSERSKKPFVAINCAAIPENLLESELFGYEKGAFSGADSKKLGLVAQANGGTLFLDEIGDMSPSLQAKLLRVLETCQYRALGAKDEMSSDFRLVAATHVNLLKSVQSGAFRQDLYYRLFQYPLMLPALADRRSDIAELVLAFIGQFNEKHHTSVRGISFSALDLLTQCKLPGNVRELRHLVEFACIQTGNDEEISLSVVRDRVQNLLVFDDAPMVADKDISSDSSLERIRDLKRALTGYEIEIIRSRLIKFGGDRAKAAESLGIPKRTLAHKCLKLEIHA